METRALAIAFFYAIGTGVGGIVGPLLFGDMIGSGNRLEVALAFCIGSVVMAGGGATEIVFGVKAEQANLEDIAQPLTAEDAQSSGPTQDDAGGKQESAGSDQQRRIDEREARSSAEPRGFERYRPGPGKAGIYAPWPSASSREGDSRALDNEIQALVRAVGEHGSIDGRNLYQATGARRWGPGEFRKAVRQALSEGAIQQSGRGRFTLFDK